MNLLTPGQILLMGGRGIQGYDFQDCKCAINRDLQFPDNLAHIPYAHRITDPLHFLGRDDWTSRPTAFYLTGM
jgi:hypothetical protein